MNYKQMRVPEYLWNKIKEEAERNFRTIQGELEFLIRLGLQREKQILEKKDDNN